MKPKVAHCFFQQTAIILVLLGMFLFLFPELSPFLNIAAAAETPKVEALKSEAPKVEVWENDETPTMVQRHLFSPEEENPADKALGPRSEAAAKLEKELLFTGVIHSPQGKWAIIRPKNKTKREDSSWRLSEGDEIKGYHVKEIGSNYIILVSKDKPVRLDLYRGGKKRPAPAVEPPVPLMPVPVASAKGNPEQGRIARGGTTMSGTPTSSGVKAPLVRRRGSKLPSAAVGSSKPNSNIPSTRRPNTSLADILKNARRNSTTQTGGLPPTNPFSRIIQQRQGK